MHTSWINWQSWTRAIHKGCVHIRGVEVRQKWTNADSGRGRGRFSQMWTSALKKYYSYHICEIYTYNLAVCLYIKCSFCLYPIENVWNAMEWHHFEYCLHSNVFYVIFKQNDQFFLPFSVNCSNNCSSCNVSNNASLVSARTGGGDGHPNVDRPGQGEGDRKNSQICADILYGRPHCKAEQAETG